MDHEWRTRDQIAGCVQLAALDEELRSHLDEHDVGGDARNALADGRSASSTAR